MQNSLPDFGAQRSVHRPSLSWLMWLLLGVVPILLLTVVAAVFAVDSLTRWSGHGRGAAAGNAAAPFACLGGSGLLLLVAGAVCFSDFRKWQTTRTVKLVIYEQGFSYESKGEIETCRWTEIEHIDYRRIEVKKGKYASARRANVVRSVVKQDGTMITFAETLDLEKITKLITTASGKP
jgi:hypothetical protein